MHWSAGSSGGLFSDDPVKEKLQAGSRRAPDRLVEDAGFAPVSAGIWRHDGYGEPITAVLHDGRLSFHTQHRHPALDDVLRSSQVRGVIRGTDYRGEPEDALRLSGEWMSYRLVQPNPYPLDVEMTRAATRDELQLPAETRSVDPSGFAIGGENSTELILGLTELNGRPVRELEAWMRPFDFDHPSEPRDFQRSEAGFLGPKDSLLGTMARDNEVVRRLGLTHAEVGEAVRMATTASARFGVRDYVGPGEHRYKLESRGSMGVQVSPFGDGGAGSSDYVLTSKRTGSSVGLSDLAGSMIGRYGFYQGAGTPYRSAPEDIVRTFEHLTEKAGGPDRIAQIVNEVDAHFSTLDALARSAAPAERHTSAPGLADTARTDGDGRPAHTTGKQGPDIRGR
ncbi:hypothetical protein [Kribbella sp. HUAS MG21]|uniref:Uncharacterized protein n=1 Tax=Kribbella sp. HUAS MG21 TaxID=3160966 RepID=A0AAU7TC15_9ACTN